MKFLSFISLAIIVTAISGCPAAKNVDIKGCTDVNALNKVVGANIDDGSCEFSSVTFYATAYAYFGIPIDHIDVSINGNSIGKIPGGFFYTSPPGNCSALGTVGYSFKSGKKVDWNATVYLSSGQLIAKSGILSPVSFDDCIKVNITK